MGLKNVYLLRKHTSGVEYKANFVNNLSVIKRTKWALLVDESLGFIGFYWGLGKMNSKTQHRYEANILRRNTVGNPAFTNGQVSATTGRLGLRNGPSAQPVG